MMKVKINGKYVCPHCNSRLEYWEEHVDCRYKKVNPLTGALEGNTKHEYDRDPHSTCGFRCTSCDYVFYAGNENPTSDLTKLIECYDRIMIRQ
jgi:hypothetical protein